MGTTLTGTTPQDTYDSLIKVTDNGPLSGTAKYLSDGLGNDSALALSTSAVGIGTSSPAGNLHIASAADTGIRIQGGASSLSYIDLADTASGTPAGSIAYNHITNAIVFNGGGTNTEFARITSAGNVGIGTSSPNVQLEVSAADNSLGGILRLNNNRNALFDGDQNGSIQFSNNESSGGANGVRSAILSLVRDTAGKTDLAFTTASSNGAASEKVRILADGGLTFNGDTAAANALDDYEEGTWTMGISFGGASVGVTYSSSAGTYTKIGRQVTVNGFVQLSNKGSSTGSARITGLPYVIANTGSNYAAPSLAFSAITFANQLQGVGDINQTTIVLEEITEAGAVTGITNADFANNSYIVLSFTYFV